MLLSAFSEDSFTSIIREIIVFVPGAWVFFYAYIVVGVLVLLNLMAAIIVENAVETSRNDSDQKMLEKEQIQSQHFKELQVLFIMMDTDKSGLNSSDTSRTTRAAPAGIMLSCAMSCWDSDCWELFTLLDVLQTGEIPIDHFFTSLRRSKQTATSRDLLWVQRRIEMLSRQMAGETTSRTYSKSLGSIGLGPCNISIP